MVKARMLSMLMGADLRVPGYVEGYVRRFWQVWHTIESDVVMKS
jgi:hypothetical protein